ncbi:VOC family protein [Pseudoxanthomonas sacheonensis]|uniref:Lactoylglutathione lyase n=1 Tax=Pseudoxanthomonas sacheonensis TaxID=443615 RepID=A0ABU1RQ13_9GAMM|nr:VOC family protein [Pseudoxanthomonas sacheonensis]MDR6840869.1 lactoylglutathione lyase [Pseudoxanthomonas sacheonensis]
MKQLINIDVPDLDAAEAFYSEAFGLHGGRRLGSEVLEMLGGTAPLYLLQKASGSIGAGDDARKYGRHWMPLHIDIVVDDLEPALARALEAGALQEGDIREANWGRIVQIADPFGHGWCLLQFLGRGYDEITT